MVTEQGVTNWQGLLTNHWISQLAQRPCPMVLWGAVMLTVTEWSCPPLSWWGHQKETPAWGMRRYNSGSHSGLEEVRPEIYQMPARLSVWDAMALKVTALLKGFLSWHSELLYYMLCIMGTSARAQRVLPYNVGTPHQKRGRTASAGGIRLLTCQSHLGQPAPWQTLMG